MGYTYPMYTAHKNSTQKGFTLVELLVVIGIIGVLASIIMVNLSSAKYRANDAKRKSDLKNLSLALSQYYNDNGNYPSTSDNWWGASLNAGNHDVANRSSSRGSNPAYIPGLAPAYTNTAALPQDPLADPTVADGWGGVYTYRSDGQSYKLIANNPPNSMVASTQPSDEFYDPVRPTTAWMVCVGATACSTW